MMYRINPTQVAQILDFDPTISNLMPFIAAAEQVITRVCAGANSTTAETTAETENGGPWYSPTYQVAPANISPIIYSAEELAVIETWLAAHFVAIRDPLYTSQSLGPASQGLLRQGGLNLAQTPYGQQAMLLDINGGLAWLNEHISRGRRARVGVTWVGSRRAGDLWYGFPWRFYALGTG